MHAITIRNVPSSVRDQLAARASQSGRSLQEYLSAELTDLASRPHPNDVLDGVRARVSAQVPESMPSTCSRHATTTGVDLCPRSRLLCTSGRAL